MVSNNLNRNIIAIGPRYFRSSISVSTSFTATRRSESAHKKGERKPNVIKEPNTFPNWYCSTNGKINLEESKITATIITETKIT